MTLKRSWTLVGALECEERGGYTFSFFSSTGRDRRMQEIQPVAGPRFRGPRAAQLPEDSGFLSSFLLNRIPVMYTIRNHRMVLLFSFFIYSFPPVFNELCFDVRLAQALVSECFGLFFHWCFHPFRCLNSIPIDFLRVTLFCSCSIIIFACFCRMNEDNMMY
jgi:hypothetical protein